MGINTVFMKKLLNKGIDRKRNRAAAMVLSLVLVIGVFGGGTFVVHAEDAVSGGAQGSAVLGSAQGSVVSVDTQGRVIEVGENLSIGSVRGEAYPWFWPVWPYWPGWPPHNEDVDDNEGAPNDDEDEKTDEETKNDEDNRPDDPGKPDDQNEPDEPDKPDKPDKPDTPPVVPDYDEQIDQAVENGFSRTCNIPNFTPADLADENLEVIPVPQGVTDYTTNEAIWLDAILLNRNLKAIFFSCSTFQEGAQNDFKGYASSSFMDKAADFEGINEPVSGEWSDGVGGETLTGHFGYYMMGFYIPGGVQTGDNASFTIELTDKISALSTGNVLGGVSLSFDDDGNNDDGISDNGVITPPVAEDSSAASEPSPEPYETPTTSEAGDEGGDDSVSGGTYNGARSADQVVYKSAGELRGSDDLIVATGSPAHTPAPPFITEPGMNPLEEILNRISDAYVSLSLGKPTSTSLFNLLLAIGAVAAAAVLAVPYLFRRNSKNSEKPKEEERERRPALLRVVLCAVSAGAAVVSVIFYFITEDLSRPMRMANDSTWFYGLLFVVTMLSIFISGKGDEPAGEHEARVIK
jgi:hypothetical protein